MQRNSYSPRKLTLLGHALVDQLHEKKQPVITHYDLFHEIRTLYQSGRNLRLRKKEPARQDYLRIKNDLIEANVLRPDIDYKYRALYIIDNGNRNANEICCLVDRFCYISHLSAMANFGLTDRRPRELHLTAPSQRILPNLLQKTMKQDYGFEITKNSEVIRLYGVTHPPVVRGQPIKVFHTSHLGDYIKVRGTFTRISTIGQTFVDMLANPEHCGGMLHVLEVWREFAHIYLEDIIEDIKKNPYNIVKVRAGYILNELLGFNDNRILKWLQFAQRGGSRVLDPSKPFAPHYSEKWMLSINVI